MSVQGALGIGRLQLTENGSDPDALIQATKFSLLDPWLHTEFEHEHGLQLIFGDTGIRADFRCRLRRPAAAAVVAGDDDRGGVEPGCEHGAARYLCWLTTSRQLRRGEAGCGARLRQLCRGAVGRVVGSWGATRRTLRCSCGRI